MARALNLCDSFIRKPLGCTKVVHPTGHGRPHEDAVAVAFTQSYAWMQGYTSYRAVVSGNLHGQGRAKYSWFVVLQTLPVHVGCSWRDSAEKYTP